MMEPLVIYDRITLMLIRSIIGSHEKDVQCIDALIAFDFICFSLCPMTYFGGFVCFGVCVLMESQQKTSSPSVVTLFIKSHVKYFE